MISAISKAFSTPNEIKNTERSERCFNYYIKPVHFVANWTDLYGVLAKTRLEEYLSTNQMTKDDLFERFSDVEITLYGNQEMQDFLLDDVFGFCSNNGNFSTDYDYQILLQLGLPWSHRLIDDPNELYNLLPFHKDTFCESGSNSGSNSGIDDVYYGQISEDPDNKEKPQSSPALLSNLSNILTNSDKIQQVLVENHHYGTSTLYSPVVWGNEDKLKGEWSRGHQLISGQLTFLCVEEPDDDVREPPGSYLVVVSAGIRSRSL